MCAVDFMHHLENDSHEQRVYSSEEDLRAKRPCVKECGVARVRIVLEQFITDKETK